MRDSGIGISADSMPHIFELFTQIPSERVNTSGGLGIGLALVRALVELHGGEIIAASDGLDRGSEFTVRLPLFASEAIASDTAQSDSIEGPGGSRCAAIS